MQTGIAGLTVAIALVLNAPGIVSGDVVGMRIPAECNEDDERQCAKPKPKEGDQLRLALRPIV